MRASRVRALGTVALIVGLIVAVMGTAARSADGALDPTFDGDGLVVTDFGPEERAGAVAVQPDGRIVVAGTGCGGDILVARYQATAGSTRLRHRRPGVRRRGERHVRPGRAGLRPG